MPSFIVNPKIINRVNILNINGNCFVSMAKNIGNMCSITGIKVEIVQQVFYCVTIEKPNTI